MWSGCHSTDILPNSSGLLSTYHYNAETIVNTKNGYFSLSKQVIVSLKNRGDVGPWQCGSKCIAVTKDLKHAKNSDISLQGQNDKEADDGNANVAHQRIIFQQQSQSWL